MTSTTSLTVLEARASDRLAPLPGCEIRAGYRVQALADGYHVEQCVNYQGGTSTRIVNDDVQLHVVEVIDTHNGVMFKTLCGRRPGLDDHPKLGVSPLERIVQPPEDIGPSLDLRSRTTAVCIACRSTWDVHEKRAHHRKTMSAEEAAWVRENVWLPWMGWYLLHEDCCKWVTCGDCYRGDHHSCRGDRPGPKGRMEPGTRPLPTGCLLRSSSDVTFTSLDRTQVFDLRHEAGTWCVCSLSDHHGAITTPRQDDTSQQTTIFDFI